MGLDETNNACLVLQLDPQRKSPRREVVLIISVKRKLFRFGSALFFPFFGDSHSTGMKPLKMFPSVSKITVSVFACPSQRW
jgi:hypothetical protein